MLAQPRCHVDLCQAVDDVAEATIPTVDHHMMFCLPGLTSTTGGIPPGCAAQHGIDGIQTRSRYSWFNSNDVSQNLGDQNLDHWTRHLGRAPSCQQESHWDRLSLHVCQVFAQFLLYGILEARAIRQAVLLPGTRPEKCEGKQHREANPWGKCVHSAPMRVRLTGQECGKRTCCTNMQLEPRCSMYICMCKILADRRQLLHDMQCNAPKTLTPGLAKVIFFLKSRFWQGPKLREMLFRVLRSISILLVRSANLISQGKKDTEALHGSLACWARHYSAL